MESRSTNKLDELNGTQMMLIFYDFKDLKKKNQRKYT